MDYEALSNEYVLHGVKRRKSLIFERALKPFYNASTFPLADIMSATPIAVLSFLGVYGISTLAEDAEDPQKNVARAIVPVCFVAGFVICFYIWLSISPLAMRLGALWTVAGIVYLAVQTGGFRRNLNV
jgi:amino acid transporter